MHTAFQVFCVLLLANNRSFPIFCTHALQPEQGRPGFDENNLNKKFWAIYLLNQSSWPEPGSFEDVTSDESRAKEGSDSTYVPLKESTILREIDVLSI